MPYDELVLKSMENQAWITDGFREWLATYSAKSPVEISIPQAIDAYNAGREEGERLAESIIAETKVALKCRKKNP